jgi:hypothetical protein
MEVSVMKRAFLKRGSAVARTFGIAIPELDQAARLAGVL